MEHALRNWKRPSIIGLFQSPPQYDTNGTDINLIYVCGMQTDWGKADCSQ